MKKFFKAFCILFLSLMLVGFVSPSLVAFAEDKQTPAKYELVPYNFTQVQSAEAYNIEPGLTYGRNYNPFDYEAGAKREGMSFALATTDHGQIENGYVTPLTPEVPEGEYSLYIWIHFDGLLVHNLDLSLELENGSSLKWSFNQDYLLSLVKKNSDLVIEPDPYAWNLFELPFAMASHTGEVFTGDKLSSVERITFNYTSEIEEELGYSNLRFYDIYISEAQNDSYNVTKQQYLNYSFNFVDQNIASSYILGDSLTIKTKAAAINYAYQDDENLLTMSENIVKWKVKIARPSKNTADQVDWGSTITFDEEGTWVLYYMCVDVRQSDTSSSYDTPIITAHQSFTISKINGVYFDSPRVGLDKGQSYIINVHVTDIFDSVGDFTFDYNPEELQVEYLGEGQVKVTALKAGDFDLVAKVQGTRAARPELSTYSNKITIHAVSDEDKYGWLRITLWCILGVIGVVLIIFTIKLLVKARRIDVK